MTDNSERQKVLDSFVHQHNYEKRLLGDSYNFDTKHDHILYSAETAKDSWEEKRKKVQNKIKRLNREIEKLTKEINSLKGLEKSFTYSRDVFQKQLDVATEYRDDIQKAVNSGGQMLVSDGLPT